MNKSEIKNLGCDRYYDSGGSTMENKSNERAVKDFCMSNNKSKRKKL